MYQALVAALIALIVVTLAVKPVKALSRHFVRIDSESQRLDVSLGNVQGEPEPQAPDGLWPQPLPWMGALINNQGTSPLRNVRGAVLSLNGEVKRRLDCDLLPANHLITDKWKKVPGDDPDKFEYQPHRPFNAVFRVEFTDRNGSRWVADTEGLRSRLHTQPWVWPFLHQASFKWSLTRSKDKQVQP